MSLSEASTDLPKGDASAAPSVTIEQINNAIEFEDYFTAADGAFGAAMRRDGTALPPSDFTSLALLTFCVLSLDNGFTVVGQSACVSRANFDAEKGRQYAREDAVRKMWPLLGFRLADQLARPAAPPLSDADAAADLAGEPRPGAFS